MAQYFLWDVIAEVITSPDIPDCVAGRMLIFQFQGAVSLARRSGGSKQERLRPKPLRKDFDTNDDPGALEVVEREKHEDL